MDRQADFKAFQELLDQLCAAFGRAKASDAMVSAYWDALKDVHLSEVRFHVKRFIAMATKDTPFPRPRELRNHAPAHHDRNLPGIDANLSGWAALKQRDPVQYEVEFAMARAARELAALSALDPGYDEWTHEYQQWAALRYAPREAQESALARVAHRPAQAKR